MRLHAVRLSACIVAAASILAGCGGSSSSSSSNGGATPAATDSAMPAGPTLGPVAPIPQTLKCSGAIVWVNLSKKIYHMAGDRSYGRTKKGEYMCQSDAEAHGYHMAGTPKNHTGNTMDKSTTAPSPAYT